MYWPIWTPHFIRGTLTFPDIACTRSRAIRKRTGASASAGTDASYSGSKTAMYSILIWWTTTSKEMTQMAMKTLPHPGHSIKDACLDPLGLTVTEGAEVLGVARHTLSRVINGQAGISPEMAIRLEKAGWSDADHWMRVQAAYDLAQARRHEDVIKVRRYEPQPAL